MLIDSEKLKPWLDTVYVDNAIEASSESNKTHKNHLEGANYFIKNSLSQKISELEKENVDRKRRA